MTLFRTKPWEFVGRRTERNAPKGYRCDETCTHPKPSMHNALCTVCHTCFKSVAGFDRHRDNGWCLEPSTIGLEPNENGFWRVPLTPAQIERLRTSFGDDDEGE